MEPFGAGQRLIPDAAGSDQEWIEAIFLHRMLCCMAWQRSPVSGTMVFGIRAVRPSAAGLTLHVPDGVEPMFASSLTAGEAVPAARHGIPALNIESVSGRRLAITTAGVEGEIGVACSWRAMKDAFRPGRTQDTISVITLGSTAGRHSPPHTGQRSALCFAASSCSHTKITSTGGC